MAIQKKYYFILLLLSCALISHAQNSLKFRLSSVEKKADILFKNKSYIDATELYKQLNKKEPSNTNVQIKLAECYRLTNDTKNAEYWYSNLFSKSSEIPGNIRLNYADVLLKNGKSDSALSVLKSYYSTNGTDSLGLAKIETLKRYNEYYQDSLAYSVNRLGINSEASDFYPVYYKEGIIFLSQRVVENHNFIKVKDSRTNSEFYKFYYSAKSGEGYKLPENIILFKNSLNDGPLTLFNNETKVIFSKNVNGNSGSKNLNLFYTELSSNGNNWSEPNSLPFNSKDYSLSHPFYHEASNTLYFVSNKPGGFGGTDIYFVKFDNGIWGEVTNLGKEINTQGDEMFPFVDMHDVLYFSSNGYPGMGGFDIYSVDLLQNSGIINPGFPINSTFDDFSFIVSKEGKTGLFCSNRGNKGLNDDIYSVKFNSVRLEGLVVDKLKSSPIELAEVKVFDGENNKLLRTTTTNSKGRYYFPVIPGRKYDIQISKQNYKIVKTDVICTSKEAANIKNKVVLEKLNKSFVSGKVVDDTIPLVNSKVVFADLSSDSTETTFTDSLGRFQCEINTDTTNLFYIENGNFKSIYALRPLKRKRKGSGISFVTIPVEEIEFKNIDLVYLDSLSLPIKNDTLIIRNELNKESKVYTTDENGKAELNLWSLGKYSVFRKDNQDLIYIMGFLPEGMDYVNVKRDFE